MALHPFPGARSPNRAPGNSTFPAVQTLKSRLIPWVLVLQRRFLNLPGSWLEIAAREERPQGWQARGQVAMEMCSRSFYCEPSL